MGFCLPLEKANKFIEALKKEEIDPGKLANMSSAERHSFFSDLLGEENAKDVNAQFESKLLLKNQQAGLVNWAKQITGIKTSVRNDIMSKIERMDKVLNPGDADSFLADLASKKLGADISFEEAQKLTHLFKDMQDTKKVTPMGEPRSPEKLEYGIKRELLNRYITDLKENKKIDIPGATKYIAATLDLSATLSQTIKILYKGLAEAQMGNPATLKSWAAGVKIGFESYFKEAGGKDAMLPVRADVLSRDNALNGKYDAAGKTSGLGVQSEEAFPQGRATQALESIPIIGRLFKGAEAAFNGAILRVRADAMDNAIFRAEQSGVDTLNKEQMTPIGQMISSMTGRGSIGKLESVGGTINAYAFSIKFLKSNWDTLVAPIKEGIGEVTDKTGVTQSNPGEVFARRTAAVNTLKVITSLGEIYALANLLKPGSVDFNPNSTNFGTIKIGDNRFDPTGKMRSLVILASRLATGKYVSSNGETTDLANPKYGQSNRLDAIIDFGVNRASPLAGAGLDFLKGKDFQGNKPTIGSEALKLVTPIPIQTLEQLQSTDEDTANKVGGMILDGLGSNVITPYKKKKK